MLEIAAAFVATITALSEVVKGIRATKELSDEAVALSREIMSRQELDNESVLALAETTIDPDLIEIAQENIEKALDRLKRDWKDPTVTQAGKDDALEAASFTICSELKRIKRLNGGNLPGHDRFHELWASHGC